MIEPRVWTDSEIYWMLEDAAIGPSKFVEHSAYLELKSEYENLCKFASDYQARAERAERTLVEYEHECETIREMKEQLTACQKKLAACIESHDEASARAERLADQDSAELTACQKERDDLRRLLAGETVEMEVKNPGRSAILKLEVK